MSTNFKYVFFDLDGTVTDSYNGIINSVIYALGKMGITPDPESFNSFIGPPLAESFMRNYSLSAKAAEKAVAYYREYYREKGIFDNTVYNGIETLFNTLIKNGHTLVLATSKPEHFAKQILKHFGLDKYFTFIAGATFDKSRNEKDEVIAYALASLKITDKSSVLMIGDRKHDIIGAHKNGIKAAGVLYGYGDREELTAAGADYIAADTDELIKIII